MSGAGQVRRAEWTLARERLRASARELFATRGYRGTTTRELADHAGVALMTLHRHYPRKADLFEDAILAPIEGFLTDYLASRARRGDEVLDSTREIAIFFDGLVETLMGQENVFIAASIAFSEHDGPMTDELGKRYAAFLDVFEDAVRVRVDAYGLRVDPRLASRILIGMAVSVVSNAQWLFPNGPQPTREELIAELSKIAIWGIAGSPDAQTLGPIRTQPGDTEA